MSKLRDQIREALKDTEFKKDFQSDDSYVENPDGTRYVVGKSMTGKVGVWHMTKDGNYVDSNVDSIDSEEFDDEEDAKKYTVQYKAQKYKK